MSGSSSVTFSYSVVSSEFEWGEWNPFTQPAPLLTNYYDEGGADEAYPGQGGTSRSDGDGNKKKRKRKHRHRDSDGDQDANNSDPNEDLVPLPGEDKKSFAYVDPKVTRFGAWHVDVVVISSNNIVPHPSHCL